MFWYRKTYPRYGAQWAEDQSRFASLQVSAVGVGTDAFMRMMMVAVEDRTTGTEDVYLRVPSRDHVKLFPGYELATEPRQPTSLLVGHQPEFERLFRRAA